MKKFINSTGLTSKEIGVIIFLLITLCAGIIIKYSGWKKTGEYDYSETDKNFESRLKSSFEELNSDSEDSISRQRAEELTALADTLGFEIEKNTKEKKKLKAGVKININTATAQELAELPGIGLIMAERIIEYRENIGKFKTTDELKKVKGIGDKKFEEIGIYITTE